MRALFDTSRNLSGVGAVAGEYTAADGVRVVVLLPDLDTLLGAPGFAAASAAAPIQMPGRAPEMDGWQMLHQLFGRRLPLH